jgi:KaiC/GvpD/RAD55 family RecA-like ATPase
MLQDRTYQAQVTVLAVSDTNGSYHTPRTENIDGIIDLRRKIIRYTINIILKLRGN